MIVHTTFTSEATGQHYPAGMYLSQSEYESLSESDRNYVDRPITADESAELFADDQRYEADIERQSHRLYDDRFDNDNEDARRERDEEDRESESGKYDAHYGMD